MLAPRAPTRRALCPECRRDMAAVLIPMEERELELNVCRICQRLWLDRQESIAGHLTGKVEPGPLPEVKTISLEAQMRMGEEMAKRVRRQYLGKEIGAGALILSAVIVLIRYWLRHF